MHELKGADGLEVRIEPPSGTSRIGWGESDWFGPATLTIERTGQRFSGCSGQLPGAMPLTVSHIQPGAGRDDLGDFKSIELSWSGQPFPLRTIVRAYGERPVVVFRLEAPEGYAGGGTGRFAEPAVIWPHFAPRARETGGVADGTVSYAHQWAEFALPLFGDANVAGFLFAPHRPPVVQPLLLIAPDGRTLLIGPLDQFHEQIIAVPSDTAEGVRCGWHGDLAEAPRGFATELAVWAAASPRAALDEWIGWLRLRHETERPSRYADPGLARLSYWTDNGAFYYYRTEPDADYTTTIARAVDDCESRGIPINLVQIDSWFYPHEHLRPVSTEGAALVPPSGMMCWEPRADVFPEGFADLRRRLGNRPLAFHSRHFARRSPYFERFAAWIDGDYAHPQDGALFDRLLRDAASWGAVTYEQDWMVESFLGVRGLRAAPDRARAWQESLDRAAAEHGLTLQWCMATPPDFLQSVTLRRLTSIRTSGDYRYLFDNGLNWVWFLHTNALARAAGLNAFKDVFLCDRDAEPYAEIEALLAALSAGPVGIGDRIGRADRALVMRTCREDGMLIKPDAPLAALDHCFSSHGYLAKRLLVGETYSRHAAGSWVYVVALHASRERGPIAECITLPQLGSVRPPTPVLAYDWRRGRWTRLEPDGGWEVELAWQDWDFRILCPLLPGDRALFGDVGKYATAGDRRLARVEASADELAFEVLGVPATTVEIHGYAPTRPNVAEAFLSEERRTLPPRADAPPDGEWCGWDEADGRFVVRVRMGRANWVSLRLAWT